MVKNEGKKKQAKKVRQKPKQICTNSSYLRAYLLWFFSFLLFCCCDDKSIRATFKPSYVSKYMLCAQNPFKETLAIVFR